MLAAASPAYGQIVVSPPVIVHSAALPNESPDLVANVAVHQLLVMADNTVLAWGVNDTGQLGVGAVTPTPPNQNPPIQVTPVPVLASPGGVPFGDVTLALARSRASFAIRRNGSLWAWGSNGSQALGLDPVLHPDAVPTPTPVAPGQCFIGVASSGLHTLALRPDGTVWSWGYNFGGQLGRPSLGAAFSGSPAPVPGLTDVRYVAAWGTVSYAIKHDGSLWAWGANNLGQYGLGTTTGGGPVPTRIPLPAAAAQVEFGNNFVMVRLQNGAVLQAEMLNNNPPTALAPVALPVGATAIDVAGGLYSRMILLADNRTLVEGNNFYNELGDCALGSTAGLVSGPTLVGATDIITNGAGWLYLRIGKRSYAATWGETATLGYFPNFTDCTPTILPLAAVAGTFVPNYAVTLASTAPTGGLCLGNTATLSASSAVGYTYTWSAPNFTATGATVSVGPSASTTYTLTTRLPNGCTGPTASVTVAVLANCCALVQAQQSGAIIVNVAGIYSATTGSPFLPATAGPRTYRVTAPVTLQNLTYALPANARVLVEPRCPIQLTNGAALVVEGALFTAACDAMWDGVYVRPSAAGLLLTTASNGQRASIHHSLNGLVFDEPTLGTTSPYLQIASADFRNNFVGLNVARVKTPSMPYDYVSDCTFDSDPQAFKIPYQYQNATTNYYSQFHVELAGDVRQGFWSGNTFAHAMVGLHVAFEGYAFFKLDYNVFRDCYLAGIYAQSVTRSTLVGPGADLNRNEFYFPDQQPATTQRSNPGAYNCFYYGNQCHGALLGGVSRVTDNLFIQPLMPAGVAYNNFGGAPYNTTGAYRLTQIGLRTNFERATGNTFLSLAQGIVTTLARGSRTPITGNTFRDCERGVVVNTIDGNYPQNPVQTADPILYTTCNTFERNATRAGLARGLVIEPGVVSYNIPPGLPPIPPLVLDDYSTPLRYAAILKDLFLPQPYGRPSTEFRAIENNSGVSVSYKTFAAQFSSLSSTSYQPYVTANVALTNGGLIDLSLTPVPGRGPCRADGFPVTGIQQRSSGGGAPVTGSARKASIEQNTPNPCSGSTTLAYWLPAGSHEAHVLMRRGLDGVAVAQIKLRLSAEQQPLDLHRYAPGLYFYTLLVDGVPVQTKRMLVE